MSGYKPAAPFTTPIYILEPTVKMVKGVKQKVYPDPSTLGDDALIFGTFRSFGGTDVTQDGVLTVEATGYIDTWYRPDITSKCRLYMIQTGEAYEIMGDPENIEMRNQYLRIRVQKIGGMP